MTDGRPDETVSVDAQYEQVYEEMRRWRDCENRIGEWFSTILLAIVGALGTLIVYEKNLFANTGEQILALVFLFLLGAGGVSATYYGGWRSRQMREWVSQHLEPQNRRPDLPPPPWWAPRWVIIGVEIVLTISAILLVLKLTPK